METAKLLLLSTFFVSILLSSSYSQNTEHEGNYKKGYNNKCKCDCDYCQKCKYEHNEWGEYGCYETISSYDFSDFKELIKGRSFESTKLEITKSGIDRNYFKTEHVKELLQLFTFESTKVELAKYAYSKTCDKNRYYKLYDVFTFESSIIEIEDFIKGKTY